MNSYRAESEQLLEVTARTEMVDETYHDSALVEHNGKMVEELKRSIAMHN
jgi:hypothetical protein